MKVAVLAYLEGPSETTPDIVVDQVLHALRGLGHDAQPICTHGDLDALLGSLRAQRPELIFNLMEMFGEHPSGDVAVAGLLELLNVPFTGGGPREFVLAGDKAIARSVLASHGVPTAPGEIVPRRLGTPDAARAQSLLDRLGGSALVKPVASDASIGIDPSSVVNHATALCDRIRYVHEDCNDDALIEALLTGPEYFVGIVGNGLETVLPTIAVDYSGLAAGRPHILCRKAKFEPGTPEYEGTRTVVDPSIPGELAATLRHTAVQAYRALEVRDYGRVDLRLDAKGRPYVLEVNPSCYLEADGELTRAAHASGWTYPELLQAIIDACLQRFAARTQAPSAALAALRGASPDRAPTSIR